MCIKRFGRIKGNEFWQRRFKEALIYQADPRKQMESKSDDIDIKPNVSKVNDEFLCLNEPISSSKFILGDLKCPVFSVNEVE